MLEFDPVRLNNLYNIPGSKHNTKRLGRGIGSGKGKTSGRGVKGQNARSGVAIKSFEGGQMPIIARLPKRGFNPIERKKIQVVKLEVLDFLLKQKTIQPNTLINNEFLYSIGLIRKVSGTTKLLGKQKLSEKLDFSLDSYSENAKKLVSESGGKIN